MSYGASIANVTQSYKDDPELRRRIEQMRAEQARMEGANPSTSVPPELPNSHGGSFVSGLIESAKSGVTLPRDVYQGKVDLNTEEGTGRVLDAAGLGMTGGLAGAPKGAIGAGPIRAYHGSPHSFDKFDLSKIGTGEGAQAYGHGLYFAEKEGTARSYRDKLAGGWQYDVREPLRQVGLSGRDLDAASMFLGPSADAATAVRDWSAWTGKEATPEIADAFRRALAGKGGSMYEVDIHADPKSLLDWDKPLREQPEMLDRIVSTYGGDDALRRRAEEFEDLSARAFEDRSLQPQWDVMHNDPATRLGYMLEIARKPKHWSGYDPGEKATGQKLYQSLTAGPGGPAAASETLLGQGVPGIRYLDNFSRGEGKGTSNYVTFSDAIVDLRRKYGIPFTAALGVGGAAAMSPTDAKAETDDERKRREHDAKMKTKFGENWWQS